MGVFGDVDGSVFAQDRRVGGRRLDDGGTGNRCAKERDPPREAAGRVDRPFRSRRAICRRRAEETYDNAFAESLFSRYKAELLEGGAFADVEQARSETFAFIEGYYNRIRRHSSLGY